MRGSIILLLLLLALAPTPVLQQPKPALAAPSGVSLAGVHYYSNDRSLPYLLDDRVPIGQRGWNVEYVENVSECEQNAGNWSYFNAQNAKTDGLVNIIRLDYMADLAVPVNSWNYPAWKDSFKRCVNRFGDVASIFIVGNEPNLDCAAAACPITATQYANAFNSLFGSVKSEYPWAELLAVGNSPFTPPIWMYKMTSQLTGTDGFAFHTGGLGGSGDRQGCDDPRQPCPNRGTTYDMTFRHYRDVISQIDQRWWSKPVYLTEFNTSTGEVGTEPVNNYQTGWINKAFEEIRHYNANRNGRPEIKALIWFVDRIDWGKWSDRALTNTAPKTALARLDMMTEFGNAENRATTSGSSQHLDAFVRGYYDNQIYHRWRVNGSWSYWEGLPPLPGGASSDPTAVAWGSPLAGGRGPGRIDVFVRCGYSLCHSYFDGQWRPWQNWGTPTGIQLIYAPDVASWSWGNLEVFAVGHDRKIYQYRYNYVLERAGLPQVGWRQAFPDGTANSSVSVVSWGSGRLDLFVRGTENQLWQRSWTQRVNSPTLDDSDWSNWQIGAGMLSTGPDAATWGAGRIDVFMAGQNSYPLRLSWENGQTTWAQISDGWFTSDPGAVSAAYRQVSLFARGEGSNDLCHKEWTSVGEQGWGRLEGVLRGGPDAASWSLR
ncbi:MAG TPA: hypothetical protein VFM55_10825 [Micromonosporaceae bacterium]|nr:hypothetical protein [Micromonosporaceae bacterium]